MGSQSAFGVICMLHSVIAITSGALMMFYMKEAYTFGHGVWTATKILGSPTPPTNSSSRPRIPSLRCSFFTIGFILLVSFVKDKDFQAFFAEGCTLLCIVVAFWRTFFEREVNDLAWDWLHQSDALLALSWIFFIIYSWRGSTIRLTTMLELLKGY